MRKKVALEQLERQNKILNNQSLRFSSWQSNTASLLMQIFPKSGKIKVKKLDTINQLPELFLGSKKEEKEVLKKQKALVFITSLMLEIKTSGMENRFYSIHQLNQFRKELSHNKVSFEFWLLLFSIIALFPVSIIILIVCNSGN